MLGSRGVLKWNRSLCLPPHNLIFLTLEASLFLEFGRNDMKPWNPFTKEEQIGWVMQIQMPKKTTSHLGCWDVKSESDRLPRVVDVGFPVVLIGCWFIHRRCQNKKDVQHRCHQEIFDSAWQAALCRWSITWRRFVNFKGLPGSKTVCLSALQQSIWQPSKP